MAQVVIHSDPIAPEGALVKAMTYKSEDNELSAYSIEGILKPRWVEVWQKWQYDVLREGWPSLVQVDPDTIEVVEDK